jgi:PAS domain-containing protein
LSEEEAAVGTPRIWLDHVHPDDRARVEAAVGRAIAGRTAFVEEYRVAVAPDEEVRWIISGGRAAVGADGRAISFDGISIDATARKATAAASRTSEARLRLALEAGRMGVWHADVATRTTRWDEAQCRIYGVDPASFEPSDERFSRSSTPRIGTGCAPTAPPPWRAVPGSTASSASFAPTRARHAG